MSVVMKGAPIAAKIRGELKLRADSLREGGILPKLGIVRVGAREDDIAYEKGIIKKFGNMSIEAEVFAFEESVEAERFEKEFIQIANDRSIHGILLFRPFPKHLDEERIIGLLPPEKDLDGMTSSNMAKIFCGGDGYAPCTPEGVIEMLSFYGIDPDGKHVVIAGRSLVVGKPLAMLMLGKNATVTVCHSKTKNLREVCKTADIFVAAVGRPRMFDRSYIKENAVVVDVGVNVDKEGNLCGDVDYEDVVDFAGFISPVPGGTGTVTTSVLARHLLNACERLVRL